MNLKWKKMALNSALCGVFVMTVGLIIAIISLVGISEKIKNREINKLIFFVFLLIFAVIVGFAGAFLITSLLTIQQIINSLTFKNMLFLSGLLLSITSFFKASAISTKAETKRQKEEEDEDEEKKESTFWPMLFWIITFFLGILLISFYTLP